MVALKNGIIQNKDGHPFDRSTGTWKNQNVAENPNVVQENVSNSDEKNTSTKNSDTTTQNSNSTETQQTDAENKNPSATNEKSTAETPKPRKIYYNIDGKLVYVSVDDLAHFEEVI